MVLPFPRVEALLTGAITEIYEPGEKYEKHEKQRHCPQAKKLEVEQTSIILKYILVLI